ncbi:hypothetical protein J2X69_002341 [Algoriphagus sp. 4150]|uniref:hypothetical protein n=1 Tax=Algoriphagus sp. 4150 TaxID=2817756 RepID=UPI00286087E6|nr:hypothetical protein [Algoriphagus sp. 4150]MDR7129994.1 hypothetical protein [Algoriphagus sp. 4150]
MSLILRITFLSITALAIFSCSNRKTDAVKNEDISFSFDIIDSVEIDYLGEMRLIDYDSELDKYLVVTDDFMEYMEVTQTGEVLTHHKLNPDGVDAVASVLGIGYLEGDVTVMSETKGYLRFRDSVKVGEIKIPYEFQPYMFFQKLGVFQNESMIYYPKPWPASSSIGMGEIDFYQTLYNSPIIEGKNVETGDTVTTVRLPESSALRDGQMHGMLFPVYTRTEENLLLSTWFEPKIYVYQKGDLGFDYEKTVTIDIPGWVENIPSSSDDPSQYYLLNTKQIGGAVTNLFKSEEYYVAVYHRGLSEENHTERGNDMHAYMMSVRKADPFYAAIFDKDFNQLATDLAFPATSDSPTVLNKNGEFVVSKVAGLSETEDDGIILYTLQLNIK